MASSPIPALLLMGGFNMDDIYGYDSPIMMEVKKHCDKIVEERENEMMMRIEEEIGLHIDKDELVKALNYDRNQYNKGYANGYSKGYTQGKIDAIEELKKNLGIVSPSKLFNGELEDENE